MLRNFREFSAKFRIHHNRYTLQKALALDGDRAKLQLPNISPTSTFNQGEADFLRGVIILV
jgi:hypothetical protein